MCGYRSKARAPSVVFAILACCASGLPAQPPRSREVRLTIPDVKHAADLGVTALHAITQPHLGIGVSAQLVFSRTGGHVRDPIANHPPQARLPHVNQRRGKCILIIWALGVIPAERPPPPVTRRIANGVMPGRSRNKCVATRLTVARRRDNRLRRIKVQRMICMHHQPRDLVHDMDTRAEPDTDGAAFARLCQREMKTAARRSGASDRERHVDLADPQNRASQHHAQDAGRDPCQPQVVDRLHHATRRHGDGMTRQ